MIISILRCCHAGISLTDLGEVPFTLLQYLFENEVLFLCTQTLNLPHMFIGLF